MAGVHRHRGKRFHHREQALGIGYRSFDVLPQQRAQPQPANEATPVSETIAEPVRNPALNGAWICIGILCAVILITLVQATVGFRVIGDFLWIFFKW